MTSAATLNRYERDAGHPRSLGYFLITDTGQRAIVLLLGKEFYLKLLAASGQIVGVVGLVAWAKSRFPSCDPILLQMIWGGYQGWRALAGPPEEANPKSKPKVVRPRLRKRISGRHRKDADTVLKVMKPARIYTLGDLAVETGLQKPDIGYALAELMRRGEVARVAMGRYELLNTKSPATNDCPQPEVAAVTDRQEERMAASRIAV